MPYPQSLSGLTIREEITDTLVRGCLGLDSNDKSLWESVWAADPDISLGLDDDVSKGLESINKNIFDLAGPMDTQHLLSSIRVNVKGGESTAHVTANVLAQHYRAGEGNIPNAEYMLAGATYDVQIVKEADGQWKIKTWIVKITWTHGTKDVMTRPSA